MMKYAFIILILIAGAVCIAGCAEEQPPVTPTPTPTPTATPVPTQLPAEKTIVETAIDAGSFSTLVSAVQAAGLVDTLNGEGPFTVFAPTDDAFDALPDGTVAVLLADPQGRLTEILLYHVVPGNYMAADVATSGSLVTAEGSALAIDVSGGNVMVDGAQVIQADIECSNGVIHVIDAVMIPPEKDIVDTAIADGNFTTLVIALEAAGLDETLKGPGPFTVFAPTDDAFAALPEGTIAALLEDPEGDLTDILLYHVVPGKYMAVDVLEVHSLETASGRLLTIDASDEGVMVDGAKVVVTDIECENGVIHVIDAVMIP
jgi:transforming growth factor-beta-induced protein